MTTDFAAVRALDDEGLHALLAGDDPVARVWAIWCLGLRATDDARSLATHLEDEPEPGVRRALAVVLAGHGHVELLVALARHDPDVYVRASASQMVARFAHAGRVPWSVVRERFDDAVEVRAAVISQLTADSPRELHAAVVACLTDADAMVRREAFETALGLREAGHVSDRAVVDWLEAATRGERQMALELWFERDSPATIATILAGASRPLRELAIRARPALTWRDLAPLIARDVELFDRIRAELDLSIADAPVALVILLATRSLLGDYVGEATRRLREATNATDDEVRSLLPALEQAVIEQLAWLDGGHADDELDDPSEYDPEVLAIERADLATLLALTRPFGTSSR